MNNKPVLFVNSISKSINGVENQMLYDSRRILKSKVMHRLDDVIALKYLNRKVFILVFLKDVCYNGEFINSDKYFIYLKHNLEIIKINLAYISEIKITSFQ